MRSLIIIGASLLLGGCALACCCLVALVAIVPTPISTPAAEALVEEAAAAPEEPTTWPTVITLVPVIMDETPRFTLTPTVASPPTPLEAQLSEVEGVADVRLASMRQMAGGGTLIYLEIDTTPGHNTEETAQALYQTAYQSAIATYGSGNVIPLEFSAILWDGSDHATDWIFDNEADTWRTTDIAAPQQPSTNTPRAAGISAPNATALLPSSTPRPTNTPRPTSSSSEPDFDTNPASGTRYTTANGLNVRSGPGTNYNTLGSLLYGTAVTITGESGGWYRINYNGGEGWIASQYAVTNRPNTITSDVSSPDNSGSSSDSNTGTGSGSSTDSQINPTLPPPPGAVRGAADSCYAGFDWASCANYQPAPGNCDEVVARGIPEQAAACCFPARDRDKDGVACYGS